MSEAVVDSTSEEGRGEESEGERSARCINKTHTEKRSIERDLLEFSGTLEK